MNPDNLRDEHFRLADEACLLMGDERIRKTRHSIKYEIRAKVCGAYRSSDFQNACSCGAEGWLSNIRPWPDEPNLFIGECHACGNTLECSPYRRKVA